jgi:hypothetical protein
MTGGPASVGKGWFSCAAHKACRDNRWVLYERIPKCLAISGLPPAVSRDSADACPRRREAADHR